jgi:hypothetical protein
MSIENITAALILAKHDIYSGRFSQAFVLAALATRMALALSLHREMPAEADISRVERETRRRLMYSCYSLDRTMSTGVPEFLSVPAHLLHIRLPCAEQKFNLGIESDTPTPNLEDPGADDFARARLDEVGMFGQHVRLLSIRANILRVARNRRESDLPPWDPSSLFAMARHKLDAWFNSLPLQFQLEPETVFTRQFQNELTPLTMLHVWYNINVVELTRISMPGFTESLPADLIARAPQGWVQQTRDVCVSHARLVARTLGHIASLVDMETLVFADQSLPICVYESARVRLQYAFLLPHEQQPAELEELTSDVAIMTAFIERMGRHFQNSKFLVSANASDFADALSFGKCARCSAVMVSTLEATSLSHRNPAALVPRTRGRVASALFASMSHVGHHPQCQHTPTPTRPCRTRTCPHTTGTTTRKPGHCRRQRRPMLPAATTCNNRCRCTLALCREGAASGLTTATTTDTPTRSPLCSASWGRRRPWEEWAEWEEEEAWAAARSWTCSPTGSRPATTLGA